MVVKSLDVRRAMIDTTCRAQRINVTAAEIEKIATDALTIAAMVEALAPYDARRCLMGA